MSLASIWALTMRRGPTYLGSEDSCKTDDDNSRIFRPRMGRKPRGENGEEVREEGNKGGGDGDYGTTK